MSEERSEALSDQPVLAELEPADRPDGLGSRLLRPHTIASFLIAIGIVVFLIARLDIDPGAVWENLKAADPKLVLFGTVVYYSTFVVRAYRWRWMLAQAGISERNGNTVPGLPRLVEILLLSWFVNCIVPAKLGDGYRCYLLKRDAKARFATTLGTLLAERVTDLVVLFVTMSVAGFIAFHGDLPSQVTQWMLFGLGLIALGVAGIAVLGLGRDRFQRFVPKRFHGHYDLFHVAIFASFRRPGLPMLLSLCLWMMDGLRLYVVAAALGAGLSFQLAVFVVLMGALLTTIPITPAGLGVVEAAIIVVLKLVDVQEDMAGSIVFLDRLIGYWSLVLVGLVLYVWRLKTEVAAVAAPANA
jgi:glycosyltransferase 2 family protein